MKQKLLCLLLAGLLLFSLPGCEKSEAKVLRVNEVTHSVFYAPFYLAIELGYFADEGLKIELTNGGGSDKSMTALLTGQADIGFMGPETAVYVASEGKEDHPVVIAQVTQRDGSFLVGKEKDDAFSWEKLRGKSVIGGRTGGMPEMTLEYVLKKNGIDPKNDLTLRTDVSFDLMGGAFLAGQDDYVALFEPSASTMALAGEGSIVASVGQGTDTVAYTGMMVTQSYRDAHRSELQAFVNALFMGQRWAETHTAAEIAAAIAPTFPDSDVQLLERVVKNYQDIKAWKTDPVTRQEDYTQLLEIIAAAGNLSKKPPFEAVVDNSFALAAE